MWRTSWIDTVWLVLMIAGSALAAATGSALSAMILGFCAGNQAQICIAGAWWSSLRDLHKSSRSAANEVFEDQMEARNK